MKKRFIAVGLILVMFLSIQVLAAQVRSQVIPSLSFSSTTANCAVTVVDPGAEIDIELTLWYGNTKVASWNDSGTSVVSIDETCRVVKGRTYTLTVTGTINNEDITPISVTKTC